MKRDAILFMVVGFGLLFSGHAIIAIFGGFMFLCGVHLHRSENRSFLMLKKRVHDHVTNRQR